MSHDGSHAPEPASEYPDSLIELLGVVWGEGFMSPGGADEVAAMLQGVAIAGRRVLDVGCGAGGVDLLLLRDYAAAQVVGVDIEATVLAHARSLLDRNGFAQRAEYVRVAPGVLPFAEATFDVVVSKEAVIHIADKEAWCRDMHRLLRQGGVLVASDWLRCDENAPSAAMQAYMDAEGLSFTMSALPRLASALRAAGFVDVELRDRNDWYRGVVRHECEQIEGPLYGRLCDLVGRADTDRYVDVWRKLRVVVEQGELRPGHFRGRKPLASL